MTLSEDHRVPIVQLVTTAEGASNTVCKRGVPRSSYAQYAGPRDMFAQRLKGVPFLHWGVEASTHIAYINASVCDMLEQCIPFSRHIPRAHFLWPVTWARMELRHEHWKAFRKGKTMFRSTTLHICFPTLGCGESPEFGFYLKQLATCGMALDHTIIRLLLNRRMIELSKHIRSLRSGTGMLMVLQGRSRLCKQDKRSSVARIHI